MLEAAGDVGGLVLEVQREIGRLGPSGWQRIAQQVGVGAAAGIRPR